ncbi:hypothetical protein BH20ACI4_BH20ACI4_27280 [soil metagenome]
MKKITLLILITLFTVSAFAADGDLDTSFGTNGIVNEGSPYTGFDTVVVQPDRKILAAGRIFVFTPVFANTTGIVLYNPNGSLDTTFGAGGQIIFAPIQQLRDLVLQTDGKIIAVGVNQPGNSITARINDTDSAPPVNNPALRVANFDGDGKTDTSVFRNGTWYINPSGSPSFADAPNAVYAVQFGLNSDKLVPADYDGDGKTNLVIFRDGLWAILQSSNNQQRYESFGQAGDRIAADDYDDGGKTDLAVFRSGIFYIKQSASSQSAAQQFGAAGDVPVAAAFVQ